MEIAIRTTHRFYENSAVVAAVVGAGTEDDDNEDLSQTYYRLRFVQLGTDTPFDNDTAAVVVFDTAELDYSNNTLGQVDYSDKSRCCHCWNSLSFPKQCCYIQ